MSGACQDRRSRWQEIQKSLQFIQSNLPFPGSQEQYEGLYDQALEDCEKALQLNDGNHKALYRKAKSLKEMGRHQEAYEAVAKCSLAVPQDASVTQLTQDLAKILGLKIRKAYVRSKSSHGSSSVEDIEIEVPQLTQDSGVLVPVPAPIQVPVVVHPPLNDAAVDELPPSNSILSAPPSEPPGFESVPLPVSVPTSVPLPVPTFVNGCRTSKPCLLLESSQDFDADIIGDDLDDLLDQAGPEAAMVIPTVKGPLPLPTSIASGSSMSIPFLMPSHINTFLHSSAQQCTVNLPPLYHKSGSSAYFGMDTFDALTPPLDSLDRLTMTDFKQTEVAVGKECLYPGHCTFAYCQEEIDVWTLERKGFISRELLFDPFGPNSNVCFDHKPRIISKTNKDDPSLCSHPVTKHDFEDHKCLVHILKENTVRYSKIRPLSPQCQLDLCRHEVRYGCVREDDCFYAHSLIELKVWMMQHELVPDMDQLYEQWLQSQKPGWGEETSNNSVRENGKQIHMPTDYAEEVAGNHCWLCGKNCNSEKQWQQHITSEKHKDRVFNSEDDQNCWQYRFPTGTFKVCERFLKGTCTEDDLCKLAHGEQELKEWMERREFLLMKLAKARKDHLIAPNDNDFGKYSFLLKDIK
eukprot:superscaffoldBa00000184_g2491